MTHPVAHPATRPMLASQKVPVGIFLKVLFVLFFVVAISIFPSQPPDFIKNTVFVKLWGMFHLLFIGVAFSYGLFGRRNQDVDYEIHPIDDIYQVPSLIQFFDSGVEHECAGSDENNSHPAWWNLHCNNSDQPRDDAAAGVAHERSDSHAELFDSQEKREFSSRFDEKEMIGSPVSDRIFQELPVVGSEKVESQDKCIDVDERSRHQSPRNADNRDSSSSSSSSPMAATLDDLNSSRSSWKSSSNGAGRFSNKKSDLRSVKLRDQSNEPAVLSPREIEVEGVESQQLDGGVSDLNLGRSFSGESKMNEQEKDLRSTTLSRSPWTWVSRFERKDPLSTRSNYSSVSSLKSRWKKRDVSPFKTMNEKQDKQDGDQLPIKEIRKERLGSQHSGKESSHSIPVSSKSVEIEKKVAVDESFTSNIKNMFDEPVDRTTMDSSSPLELKSPTVGHLQQVVYPPPLLPSYPSHISSGKDPSDATHRKHSNVSDNPKKSNERSHFSQQNLEQLCNVRDEKCDFSNPNSKPPIVHKSSRKARSVRTVRAFTPKKVIEVETHSTPNGSFDADTLNRRLSVNTGRRNDRSMEFDNSFVSSFQIEKLGSDETKGGDETNDVDVKAGEFIAKFWEQMRHQKVLSLKEQQAAR